MSGLLYAGFDYGTTANLPALWNSGTAVEIVPPPGGRFGGGCARFVAANGSTLTRLPTWSTQQTYQGFVLKPETTFETDITLAQLVTTDSTFALLASPAGALSIAQDSSVLCAAGPGLTQLGFASLVEWSVDLLSGLVRLRVNTLPMAVGAASLAMGEAFVSFKLGGGAGEVGTWLVDDVYLLDGTPRPAISIGSRLIDNAGFLGNVLVQATYPTADGYNITNDLGYTPWDPAAGTTHFNQVNENPPDGGVTNESTDIIGTLTSGHLDNYDTFQVTHPAQTQAGFGILPLGTGFWPIFALQCIYAFQVDTAHDANATVRVVDDLPSTDDVFLGATLHPTVPAYRYFGTIFDRDPSL